MATKVPFRNLFKNTIFAILSSYLVFLSQLPIRIVIHSLTIHGQGQPDWRKKGGNLAKRFMTNFGEECGDCMAGYGGNRYLK